MNAVASLRTNHANRYLGMLCEHFARRLDVTRDDQTARVAFPFGQCAMTADDQRLRLVATADTAGDLARLEDVIASHLERYAFRENPNVVWAPAADGGD